MRKNKAPAKLIPDGERKKIDLEPIGRGENVGKLATGKTAMIVIGGPGRNGQAPHKGKDEGKGGEILGVPREKLVQGEENKPNKSQPRTRKESLDKGMGLCLSQKSPEGRNIKHGNTSILRGEPAALRRAQPRQPTTSVRQKDTTKCRTNQNSS